MPSSGGTPPSRATSTDSQSRSHRRTPNVIEFVDSQNPHSRSAIQRHTAYHSAAQRRDARLQSLGTRSGYLEWQRRPEFVAPSMSSQSWSRSASPRKIEPHDRDQLGVGNAGASVAATPSEPAQSSSHTFTPIDTLFQYSTNPEEAAIQYFTIRISQCFSSDALIRESLGLMQNDDGARNVLLAYSIRFAVMQPEDAPTIVLQEQPELYLDRAISALRGRLTDIKQASSNVNIQTVLLLIAYHTDFDQPGTSDIHIAALRSMIADRDGVDKLQQYTALHYQLQSLQASKPLHLTFDCQGKCSVLPRFPQGLNLVSPTVTSTS